MLIKHRKWENILTMGDNLEKLLDRHITVLLELMPRQGNVKRCYDGEPGHQGETD